MKYDFNGKNINIPDEFIEKNMANLGMTKEEVIEMYLSDEGYVEVEEIAELTAKAKEAGPIRNQGDKTKRKAPVRKPDMVKREIVQYLYDILHDYNGDRAFDPQGVNITNIERMIAFTVDDDNYELTLTKKRKPKN